MGHAGIIENVLKSYLSSEYSAQLVMTVLHLYPVLRQIKGLNEESRLIELMLQFIEHGPTSSEVLDLFLTSVELKLLNENQFVQDIFDFMKMQEQVVKLKMNENVAIYALLRDHKVMKLQLQIQKLAKTSV